MLVMLVTLNMEGSSSELLVEGQSSRQVVRFGRWLGARRDAE
jgi:hypothetical protein